MQYQTMPFGWSIPPYLPLPPTIDDRDLFINSVINGGPGTAGPEGPVGPQGEAGVGVASAEVTDNPGDLLLLLTDGTIINAGVVVGPPGATGPTGATGAQGVPGAAGTTGATGAQGPPGPSGKCKGCDCSTVTIKEDYCATATDCYIGAQLKGPATVTLPTGVPDGTRYIIKLEFGAPVGNRKLTLEPESPALINGVTNLTLTTPYESVSVLYNNQNWWTV